MQLELADSVRLEIAPEGSRVVVRLFVGDRELPATAEMIGAVAGLCQGERRLPFELLKEHGVFVEKAPKTAPSGTLALAPTAALGVQLRAGAAEITTRGATLPLSVLPENSLPIGGFVPPEVLGPLQHLARVVREAWAQMMRAAHSRGVLVDPDEATRLLLGLVRQRLEEDPGLAALVELTDAGLKPRQALQQDTFAYPIVEVDLIDDRERSRATDRVRFGVAPHEVPVLGRLLGALGAGAEASAVRDAIADAPRLVALAGGLVATPMLAETPERIRVAPGCVAHLGHATLLANLGGAHVLIDPWFPAASEADAAPPLAVSQLPKLAGVFFTHHHWDHVNLPTLLRLPKTVPMYVPEQPEAPLVPKTAAWLRSLGFERVHTLAHGAGIDLGSGGRIVAAPFTGEDPTDTGFGGNTYVLKHHEDAAWVHVDSGPDRHGRSVVSSGEAARLRQTHGPLNPVFATRRQERGTMVEHGWEFLFADPSAWTRPTENCCNDAAFLAALSDAAEGPLVLYSEGGADWYPASTDFLRPGATSASDAIQMYLWDDLDAVRSAVSRPVEISLPRDVWRIGGGRGEVLSW